MCEREREGGEGGVRRKKEEQISAILQLFKHFDSSVNDVLWVF